MSSASLFSKTTLAIVLAFVASTSWAAIVGTPPAFAQFVGESDKGSTRVKSCDGVGAPGGTTSFANTTVLNVRLLSDYTGDGLGGGADTFNAYFDYNGTGTVNLLSGSWVLVDTNPNGTVFTYHFAPSGDIATDYATLSGTATGWADLLAFVLDQVGQACNAAVAAAVVYPPKSSMTGVLVVDTSTVTGPGVKATLSVKVKMAVDGIGVSASDGAAEKGVDDVTFTYTAKGYVQ